MSWRMLLMACNRISACFEQRHNKRSPTSPSSIASPISFFFQRVKPVCFSSSLGGASVSTLCFVAVVCSVSRGGGGDDADRSEPLKSAPVASFKASLALSLPIFQRKASLSTSLCILAADWTRVSRTATNIASSSPMSLKRYRSFASHCARGSPALPVAVSPPRNGHCSTKVINRVLKGPLLAAGSASCVGIASMSSKYLIGALMNREQQSSRKSKTSTDGADEPGGGPKLAMRASKASGDVFVCSISWSSSIIPRSDLIPA
jgi:hypothetical protein